MFIKVANGNSASVGGARVARLAPTCVIFLHFTALTGLWALTKTFEFSLIKEAALIFKAGKCPHPLSHADPPPTRACLQLLSNSSQSFIEVPCWLQGELPVCLSLLNRWKLANGSEVQGV